MFKKDRLKTTLTGLAAVLVGVKLLVTGNIEGGLAAVSTGAGLIFAKDAE